jgi:hypothetical protein
MSYARDGPPLFLIRSLNTSSNLWWYMPTPRSRWIASES